MNEQEKAIKTAILKLKNTTGYIKNYPTMCAILYREHIRGTDSINATLKELDRYCEYHKLEGTNKYIIDKVFNKVKDKTNNWKGHSGGAHNIVYGTKVYDIIINDLLNTKDFYTADTFKNIFVDRYNILTSEYELVKGLGYERYTIKHSLGSKGLVKAYSERIKSIVQGSFNKALSDLKKDKIITCDMRIKVMTSDYKRYLADEYLEKRISEAEIKAYEELEICKDDKKDKETNNDFIEKVCELLDANEIIKTNMVNYWKVYEIKLIKLDIEKREEFKEELIELYKVRIKEAIEKIEWREEGSENNGKLLYISDFHRVKTKELHKKLFVGEGV